MLSEPRAERSTERIDAFYWDIVEHTHRYSRKQCDLFTQCQRSELGLAQHCANAPPMLNDLA